MSSLQGPLRDAVAGDSYASALEFYALRDTRFVPLLRAGKRAQALELARGPLTRAYDRNRASIDTIVTLQTAKTEADQLHARAVLAGRSVPAGGERLARRGRRSPAP
jgi:hypothetical protein